MIPCRSGELTLPDREAVRKFLLEHLTSRDAAAIMGARDNSLSDYAESLCAAPRR